MGRYLALPRWTRLGVTLSFTLPGMLGLYLLGDGSEDLADVVRSDDVGFFQWCYLMAIEELGYHDDGKAKQPDIK
jgi:hypothetical protein